MPLIADELLIQLRQLRDVSLVSKSNLHGIQKAKGGVRLILYTDKNARQSTNFQ